jgi:hypothetical protein
MDDPGGQAITVMALGKVYEPVSSVRVTLTGPVAAVADTFNFKVMAGIGWARVTLPSLAETIVMPGFDVVHALVSVLDGARVELLAGDHVLVTVPHRPGLDRG